jgi:hypothetical protein
MAPGVMHISGWLIMALYMYLLSTVSGVDRISTHTVVMIPSPMKWGDRRELVNTQFLGQSWKTEQVVLVYFLGTRTGTQLEIYTPPSHEMLHEVNRYVHCVNYVFTPCRDWGDEINNPNGTSSTTCNVYEGLKYVDAMYESKYVWRSADDAYLNLHMWFQMEPLVPSGDIYMGYMRYVDGTEEDLKLSRQPLMQRETFSMLPRFGPYMSGMGYVLSASVAHFIATATIAPKLTWCEDVMVGMWLLPFQIRWIDSRDMNLPMVNRPEGVLYGRAGKSILLMHYMQEQDWDTIHPDGRILFSEEDDTFFMSLLKKFIQS